MKITKRQQKQLEAVSQPLKDLVKSIEDSSIDSLPGLLKSNLEWDTSNGSLLNWISVLNKFDDILETITTEHGLSEEFVKPVEFDSKTTDLLVSILKFTQMLLSNNTFKSVYASSHRLFDLLNSPTIPVIIAVLECFVVLGKKFSVKTMRTTFISQRKVSDRLYPLALFLPAATLTSNTGSNDNYSLIDFVKDNAHAPEKWKHIEYFFYPDEPSKNTGQSAPPSSAIENSPSLRRVKSQQSSSSPSKRKKSLSQEPTQKQDPVVSSSKSTRLYVSEEDVLKLTLQQLYDKGSERLPSKYWMRFSLKAMLTKAFNSNSYESIKLRQDLVVIKALATSILVSVHSEFEVSSRIFEADPTLLSSFIDLINLQNPVPRAVRIASVKVLDCISSLKTWSSEIVRALSGSVSHGLLFQNLRHIIKQLKKNNRDDIDEEFNIFYFKIISNILQTKSLAVVLISAGLVQHLTEFITLRSDYKVTLSAAVQLLDSAIVHSSDNVALFRENDGFINLIAAIGHEIDFAIESPGYYGPPPSLTITHYSISFKQANYNRFLLRFVHHLIQRESGDSVRNLFDSPILKSINKILTNISIFGYSLVTLALNIVSAIIHNEPTSFPILKEAGTIDIILTRFGSFIGVSSALISALPTIIGAIALNTEGLQSIKEHNVIAEFFKIFDDCAVSKELVNDEISDTLSSSFDELARYYPDLKPIIIQEIVQLIKRLPEIGTAQLPAPYIYTSDKGWFYHSRDEEIIDNEEGSDKLVTWESIESAYVLENASVFLGNLIQFSSSWTSIMDSLPVEHWLPLICLTNSPFDYVYSNSMYPLNGVLKYFDDDRRGYAINEIIQETSARVGDVLDFASSKEKLSVFQKLEGDVNSSNDLLNRLITVNNVLFALTDVYCNPTSLSTTRVEQLAKCFSTEDGLKLISNLGLLLERVGYEENVLRETMPVSVADETCSNQFDDGFPPLKIVAKEANDENTHEKTSAKFKNAVQIRFTLQRIHTSITIIFNTLISLPTISRTDLTVDEYRGLIVRIGEEIAQLFVRYLESALTSSDSCLLVKLHTIHYCLTDHKLDKALTIGAILFMQIKGLLKETEILKKFWGKLISQDNDKIKKKEPTTWVTELPQEIVASIVLSILTFFNKINDFEGIFTVPHGPLFYEGDYSGSINVQGNVMRAGFTNQAKILSFGALSSIFEEDSFSSLTQDSKIPELVAEEVVTLASHSFYHSGSIREIARSDGTLFELHWKQARISRNRIDYLVSLGLTEEESLRILSESGGDLTVLGSDLQPSGFTNVERWQEIYEKAKTLEYKVPEPKLIIPQYENYHTVDDLEQLRLMKSDFFVDQILYLVQLCPKVANSVSEFFFKSFLSQGKSDVSGFEDTILQTILEFVLSFELPDSDSQQLGSMLNLFGTLVANETVFYGCHSSLETYSSEIITSIKPEQANFDWFSQALLGLEKLVLAYRVPEAEPTLESYSYPTSGRHSPVAFRLSKDLYDKLFEVLISVGDLTNEKSAVSITWVLSLYACDSEYAQRIVAAGIIHRISSAFANLKHDSDAKPALQAAYAELSRRCYETNDVLQDLVLREIRKAFSSRKNDGTFDRKKDLTTALNELYPTIMRAPNIFIEEFSKRVRFVDFKEPLSSLAVSYFESKDEDITMTDAEHDHIDEKQGSVSKLLSNQTGILHSLLTELMSTAKKDWLSDPPLTDEEKKKKEENSGKTEIPKNEKVNVHNNENCSYMIYLMKVMIELLSSYKQSKLEFLTFSKKQLFQSFTDESPKPRSTSLNFILHQLILGAGKDLASFKEPNNPEQARRRAVSELAVQVVTSFVSTIASKDLKSDAKNVDPDLTYVRKFTVDTVHKAIKEVFSSTSELGPRYSKLVSLAELLSSLILTNKTRIIDRSTIAFDDYHLAKVMLDSTLPASLSQILSEIDLNYAEYFFVLEAIVTILSRLGSIKVSYQDLFKSNQLNNGGADEEEVEEDENDFKEETPDLFQNSTLGMYDIGEIDSEDEYSDEELAFRDHEEDVDDDDVDVDDDDEEEDDDDEIMNDGRALEIVYSEDDDVDDSDDDDDEGDDDESVNHIIGSDEGEVVEDDDDDIDEDGHDVITDESLGSIISDSDSDDGVHDYDLEMASGEDEDSNSESEFGAEFLADYGTNHDVDEADYSDDNEGEIDSGFDEEAIDMIAGGELHHHRRPNSLIRAPESNEIIIDMSDDDEIDDEDEDDDDSELGSLDISNEFLQRGMRSLGNVRNHHLHNHTYRQGSQNIRSQALENLYRRGWNVVDGSMQQMNAALQVLGLGTVPLDGARPATDFVTKSTIERWCDLYTQKLPSVFIAKVISSIHEPSRLLFEEKAKEEEEAKRKREEESKEREAEEKEKRRIEEEELSANATNQDIPEEVADQITGSQDPILVRIGDREVDIAGTDIDPEFFEALPDYMREEVFTQHITERRAAAAAAAAASSSAPSNVTQSSANSREIDQDFLDALPEGIRDEILAQEALSSRISAISELGEVVSENNASDHGADGNNNGNAIDKEKQKVYFTPLVDRYGVASLIRFVFVPQSFHGRKALYQLFAELCINKQTRSEVLGYLMAILQHGITDQTGLERIFYQIASSVDPSQTPGHSISTDKSFSPRTPTTPLKSKHSTAQEQFPHRTSPFVVATQVLEGLQFLLESEPQLRFYFLTEHENIIQSKKPASAKKLGLWKQSKYPLNTLLGLLNHSVVKKKSILMDLLSRIIQITTRSLNVLQKAKVSKDGESGKKKIELPHVFDSSLRNAVSILSSDDCSARTFQQILSAMQNLLVVSSGSSVFASELSKVAKEIGVGLINDLNQLAFDLSSGTEVKDFDGEVLIKFTPQGSDQSKLLRVLTALDYLFGKQQKKEEDSTEDTEAKIKKLTAIYEDLNLGSLWGALSEALDLFEANKNITHFATVLLPVIEALMVVCKHSKIQARDVLKYENKKCDFANEPIESLFFSFTDTHKKILNHMVRSNPKLMSGPFAMLVKNPRVLEFDNKKNYFDRQLHKTEEEKPVLQVTIRRDQVFLDSYRALFFKSKEQFRDSKLEITFKGEAGVDAGGVTREWYQVLSRQMFNPDYALFLPIASDKTTFHPNRTSWVNPEHLSFFKFIGRVIGKAIYDNCFLDCHFTRDVYKSILGRSVSLKDLETIDLEYYKSLMWMLENDITDVIIETFSVDTDDYGEVKTIDLIPNGHDIAVTEENKHEYVRLIVEYRLQKSVQEQVDNFLQGFHEIIPKELISIFDEQELELLISGLPDIDVDDWKNNTTYVNYSQSSREISYFWRAVRSFDTEERAKLLQFATGTSKVPLNGFKELGGTNGSSKFSIHKDFGSIDRLPSSHTCFNQIDLPAYDSYETLRGSLLLAITEGHEGFGLA